MRIFPVAASTSAILALSLMQAASLPAAAQEAIPSHHDSVLGYQDPRTGVFHQRSTLTPDAVAAPVAGTITLTLHITLKTALATGAKVACTGIVTASSTATTGTTVYDEVASAFATVSGTAATCVVTIPHSWQMPSTSVLETLNGQYSAEIVNPTSTTILTVPVVRESSSTFVSLSGPTIFTTAPSAYSANVTL
jgi:hypothetical protein